MLSSACLIFELRRRRLFNWEHLSERGVYFIVLDVGAIQAKTKSKMRDCERHDFYVPVMNMREC